MGEQTHPQTLIQSPYTNTTDSPIAEAVNTAIIAVHQNFSSSVLPFRAQKLRKLSSLASVDNSDETSSKSVNEDTKTAIAATANKKNKIIVQPIRVSPRIIPRSLSCEGEIEMALRYLRSVDPLLARVIDVHQRPIFDSFQPPFLALTKSILYQQLAFKAGTSIYTRFVSLCGGEACVVPEAVLTLTANMLRQIGVSDRKASYLHDLANKYRNGILSDASIVDMDDKSLSTMLTMVKGIGSWSVHMFMIFSLHRPDVLPVGDLGVRRGVQHLYGLEQLPRPSQMEQLCEKWRPYRSVGSWYVWRFDEAKGAQAVENGLSNQQQLQQEEHHHQQFPDPISGIAGFG